MTKAAKKLDYQGYMEEFTAIAEKNNWRSLHSPRNLAAAVLQEAAELHGEFQWLTEQESCALGVSQQQRVAGEVADVALYLFALCEAMGIDLDMAIRQKQSEVRSRYASR